MTFFRLVTNFSSNNISKTSIIVNNLVLNIFTAPNSKVLLISHLKNLRAPPLNRMSATQQDEEHKLQTAWSFWYDKKQSQKTSSTEFRQRLHKIGTFNTIEQFWKVYLHLKRPSALEVNVNLYLFRDGPNILPMWEAFPRGGCWILKVKKKPHASASVLGKMWQDMVLALIGESFEEPDVVGISVCIRKTEDLISVWNKDNRNEDIRFHIGEKMKEILELEPSTVIEYKHHAVSMQDCSTFRNAKAYVFAPEPKNKADETKEISTSAT